MKNYIYTLITLFILSSCSSDDSTNDPDNIAPGPFSVTILETRMDGANIEWTESIDIDGEEEDVITYSIYLNDQPISIGGITLAYNFTGLESETVYDGYIIAYDGNGGTSQSNFFFETEPETLIFNVEASDWIWDSYPEGDGIREVRGAGFEVPFYEDATSYRLEILNYSIVFMGDTITQAGTYTWTNESQNDPVYILSSNGNYVVYISSLSISTLNSDYNSFIEYITSRSGEAQVMVTFGDN